MTRGAIRIRIAAALLLSSSLVGLAVAAYLAWTKVAGTVPACGPIRGCETVNSSPYSEIAGVPVALLGAAFSAVVLVLAFAWTVTRDRRALEGAYILGIVGTLFVFYFAYVSAFVIGALCMWCLAYGATVVLGLVVSLWTLEFQKGRAASGSRRLSGKTAPR